MLTQGYNPPVHKLKMFILRGDQDIFTIYKEGRWVYKPLTGGGNVRNIAVDISTILGKIYAFLCNILPITCLSLFKARIIVHVLLSVLLKLLNKKKRLIYLYYIEIV